MYDTGDSLVQGEPMKRITMSLAALVVFALSGCVQSQYMAVGDQTYPPRPIDYIIDVYMPLDAPVVMHKQIAGAKDLQILPAGSRVIGRVDTVGAPAAGWASVINDAKHKARELGGDALVIRNIDHYLSAVDSYGSAYYGKSVSMEVVRFGGAYSASASSRTDGFGTQSYDASSRKRPGSDQDPSWITSGQ